MSNVTELKCFKQVADVLGYELAVIELTKVQKLQVIRPDAGLGWAFQWGLTTQGRDFWHAITEGEIPKQEKEMSLSNSVGGDVFSHSKSDGSTAAYYELPEGAAQLQDLISHRDMNAQIGEIFRACYRYGIVAHSEKLRDAKKIKFYAEAEIARLEKETKK